MEPKNNGWNNFITEMRKNITVEKIVVRALMAWMFTTILFVIQTKVSFLGPEYAAKINIIMYLCFALLFFIFFCGLGYFKVFTWVETYGPMILITIYGFLTVSEEVKLNYVVGLAAMLLIAIGYATYKSKTFMDIKRKASVTAIYILGTLAFVGYFGCLTIFRYLTYRTPGYDFGIWVQMFHYMKTTFAPLTTCERSELLSHFAIHFSPIYYLYLPFYMVFSYPITLNVLQVLTLASGLIPLYLLCKRMNLSRSAQALFAVLFVLFPAIGCGTFYDLHENCFLVPLLLWLFYFIEKNDNKFIILFGILTCLVKEDAPMYVACIGLFVLLSKKRGIQGSLMMLFSVLYFVVVTILLKVFGNGVMESRFDNYAVGAAGGSMFDLLRNIITNPGYVLDECFSEDRLEFLLQMFLPIGCIPFVTKHMSRFVLLLPMLLENLASDWKYQHSISYQYAFGVSAILLYLAILNYSEFGEKTRRFLSSLALCVSIILVPMCGLKKAYYVNYYNSYYDTYMTLDQMVESIPDDASVTCSAFFLPHLAQRDVAYEYEYMKDFITDYVILDLRWGKVNSEDINLVRSAGYVTREQVDGLYIILQRADATAE